MLTVTTTLQRAHSYKLSKANKMQQQQHHIACLVQNFQQNVSNEQNNKHYQQFFNGWFVCLTIISIIFMCVQQQWIDRSADGPQIATTDHQSFKPVSRNLSMNTRERTLSRRWVNGTWFKWAKSASVHKNGMNAFRFEWTIYKSYDAIRSDRYDWYNSFISLEYWIFYSYFSKMKTHRSLCFNRNERKAARLPMHSNFE